MKNIIVILSVFYILLWDGGSSKKIALTPNVINVFAGNDRTICSGQSLTISSLNASISGDVSDGDWIPFGDGRFQPGNLMTVRYSVAQSGNITYQPGPNDIFLGSYRLMLMSDAPISGTPQERVPDEVRISFQHAPPLFCSSNINVSLDERCQQLVTAQMLSPNAIPPFNNYIITLYDDKNRVIPNNLLNSTHLDMLITYKLGHQCTSNICWGNLRVEDYFPPQFECRNDTLSCRQSTLPDSVGFPIPSRAVIDTFINGKYLVSNWDYCSQVELTYTEISQKAECARDEDRTITRRWTAKDAKGNTSNCTQIIVVKRIGISTVVFPPNFNDIDLPAFNCGDSFPMLLNGHPSPDTTGVPSNIGCDHLQNTMTDVDFDLCGAGYKLARSWFVIDWCSTLSITRNQIIEIKDKKAPIITCLDTLRLNADAYQCWRSSAPIPALTSIEDCSDYDVQYTLFNNNNQVVNFIHSSGIFQNIPVGTFTLRYLVTDECNNSASCHMTVVVEDKTTPFPACKAFVKVSLGINGSGRVFATSYDNNSLDNCGIAKIEARKMTNTCNSINPQFSDHVDFCCAEIGQSVMVEVRITDIYGNANTCMVETQVEDKLPPQIICIPDISIHCKDYYDINDLSAFGKVVTQESERRSININNNFHNGLVGRDGLASDNCTVTVTEHVVEEIDCYVGRIKRTFVATDVSGRKDSCTQTIYVINDNPIDAEDIQWPQHYVGEGCKIEQLPPSTTGSPKFLRQECANLASTYNDQLFYSTDSVCLKIIREWYVVDWCQFENNPLVGRWGPHYQTIKAHNHTAPTFNFPCQDTVFCSYDAECQEGWVNVVALATDDCSQNSDLLWTFRIDLFKNGSIDIMGQTNDYVGNLPIGQHQILWRVADPCGNFSECEYDITVVDCKKPTPYCISSLTMSLDSIDKSVEIWAIDFDNGSSDNCTDVSQLIYTFDEAFPVKDSINKIHYFKEKGEIATVQEYEMGHAQKWISDKRSSALRFNCDDIPNGIEQKINVRMTVIDTDGLMDFCDVELILQDNNDVCPDVKSSLVISGEISTANGQIPPQTEIVARAFENEYKTQLDPLIGTYSISELPLNTNYWVEPFYNQNPIDGVTTLDIVMTQRHILDIVPFTSPYQHIAADANNSKSITSSDLIAMRRLVLGMTDKFPNGMTSWVFVPENDGFTHPNNPHSYMKGIETNIINNDYRGANFVGIKIGDVNFSYSNLEDDNTTTRNKILPNTQFEYKIKNIEGQNYLYLYAAEDIKVDGWQMFLNIPGLSAANAIVNHEINDHFDFYYENNVLHMMMYHDLPKNYTKNSAIATFLVEGHIKLNDIILRSDKSSEIYINGRTENINIKEKSLQNTDIALVTNPVTDILKLKINHNKSEILEYAIVSNDGLQVQSGTINITEFWDEYNIELYAQMKTGLYYLQLKNKDFLEIRKFILIK